MTDVLVAQEQLVTTGELCDDIEAYRAAGALIDDNNQPVEENVPINENVSEIFSNWGFNGVCYRKAGGNTMDRGASILAPREVWRTMSQLDYWLAFFPICFVQDVMLKEMNERLALG